MILFILIYQITAIMNRFCGNPCLERSEEINDDVNEEMYVEFLNFVILLI